MFSSHVYKIYCSFLNDRLISWLEDINLLCDEQICFRSCRKCLDHPLTITNIVNTRSKCRQQMIACIVDFSKAYYRISRYFLWKQLLNFDIQGEMFEVLKS